jgi:hypothetical protein
MSDIVYEFSGIHFPGEGVIDRVEGGCIFGHQYNGLMFMIDISNVTSFEQDERKEYEAFFMKQPFYLQLKYIHGDRLFDFDAGIGYRNLTVQVGYVCWCKEDREFVL